MVKKGTDIAFWCFGIYSCFVDFTFVVVDF